MLLTRDVVNENGVLILPAGRVIQESTIDQLQKLVAKSKQELLVYVVASNK